MIKRNSALRKLTSRVAARAERVDFPKWCGKKYWYARSKLEVLEIINGTNPEFIYFEKLGSLMNGKHDFYRYNATVKMLKKNRKIKWLIRDFDSRGKGLLDFIIWKRNDKKCFPTFVDVKSGTNGNTIPSQLKFLRDFSDYKKRAKFAIFRVIKNERYWIELEIKKIK